MNPSYLGDSYDLVKRFFCSELGELGYQVVVDPMFTGDWQGRESQFLRLINPNASDSASTGLTRTALLVDPDTGVNSKGGNQHVSFDRLIEEASRHRLVFSFDQSFSRQAPAVDAMKQKLSVLEGRGCHAIYYDSHARFLFVSRHKEALADLSGHLLSLGLPRGRLLQLAGESPQ